MSLITTVRKKIIQQLWQNTLATNANMQKIVTWINTPIILDHFAIIDLPSEFSGIATLNQIFSALNYLPQGRDYLADKQNEFMWLAPTEAEFQLAQQADPQIVIADFRFAELAPHIQSILENYTKHIKPFPWQQFHRLCGRAYHDDIDAANELTALIINYCQQREWPLPTVEDYLTIKSSNELLAWVLVFGRCVNHFGISIHCRKSYDSLAQFNQQLEQQLAIPLNQQGGKIKGNAEKGIAQSSTEGELLALPLANGNSKLNGPFIEFVWRYATLSNPQYWKDYFTGFIGTQANYVIESVYDTINANVSIKSMME